MTYDAKTIRTAIFAAISFLLILVNQFSGIRDAQPFGYWIVSSLAIAALLLLTRPTLTSIKTEPQLAHWLLLPLVVFAVYIPLMSGWGAAELKASMKYGVIAALIYAVYRSELKLSHFLVIVIATLLIQGGLFFLAFTDWAIVPLEDYGSRKGLSIATHGTIWRLGGLTFPFFVYQTLKSTTATHLLAFLLLTIVAAAVNLLDGTRTGFLILILGGLFGTGLAIWRGSHRRQILIGTLLTVVTLTGLLHLTSTSFGNRAGEIFNRTLQTITSSDSFSLEQLDGNRQRQVQTAVETISESPLQGSGWLTNISLDGYVIHNVILQTWADLGFFGMLFYLAIFTPAVLVAYRWLTNRSSSDHMVLPLSIVVCYSFSSLFHPISTELTEWVLVAFSLGLMIRWLTNQESLNPKTGADTYSPPSTPI